jgi:hypothetical protein
LKSITLDQQIQKAAKQNRGDIVVPGTPRAKRNWPICLTCGRDVEAVELKNANSKSAEIWARCHGQEDYYKVTWDVPIRDSSKDPLDDPNVGWAIKRAMGDFSPFPPEHQFDFSSKR